MTLYLVPMRLNAAKEIRTTMHIQHHTVSTSEVSLSNLLFLIVFTAHFNPFASKAFRRSTPLPPLLPTHSLDPLGAKLGDQRFSSRRQVFIGDVGNLCPHPVWAGNSLTGELLEILDGVLGGKGEEFTQNMQSFIIREMNRGFIMKGFSMQVLYFANWISQGTITNHTIDHSHEKHTLKSQ